ncbi:MAG: GDP-mannose 4,6-dehydratase [Bacteroidota bacterium]
MEKMVTNFYGIAVLVTGGTGFVGSHLVEELIRLKARVITTSHYSHPKSYFFSQELGKKATVVKTNIGNIHNIYSLLNHYKVEYIFHLAAQPLVEVGFRYPKRTLYTNVLGTINILEAARKYNKIRGIVVASSDKAYGPLNKAKYLETDSLLGEQPYEVSKSCADLISQAYVKTYDLPIVVTRFGNIYGEGDLHYNRIVPGIMKAIICNKVLKIRSNGKYIRDYLYVKDVISGYINLITNIDKTKGEAFNFGSVESLSVIDLIKLIEKSLDKKISYEILDSVKNEIPYQSLDDSKIKNRLGWQQEYNLASTSKNIYSWYKKTLV